MIEAELNLRRSLSSMMCMVALSSAISRDIKSIYPQRDNRKVKSLLDGIGKPSITVQSWFFKHLMVRGGGQNERANFRFVPNHFAAVL